MPTRDRVRPSLLPSLLPADLAAEKGTLILAAEQALRGHGEGEVWKPVRYDPAKNGWTPPWCREGAAFRRALPSPHALGPGRR